MGVVFRVSSFTFGLRSSFTGTMVSADFLF
jgi:hypothetical protein